MADKEHKVERRWHGHRGMLNITGFESTGAIVAEIEDTRHWHEGYTASGEKVDSYSAEPGGTIAISDCSRSIGLSTYVHDDESYENMMFKLDQMIGALQAYQSGLIIEYPLFRARKKIGEANEKERQKLEAARKAEE